MEGGIGGDVMFPNAGRVRRFHALHREATIYKPFGEMTEVLPPTQVNAEQKGWIGQRYDADAGLQYLNARYYDPEVGLFLQPDWFEVMAAGVGTNRYSYAGIDPVNRFDPGGNQDSPDLTGGCIENDCETAANSGMTYWEEMSNACKAGGCAIVLIGITEGVGVVAEAGMGTAAAAASLILGVDTIVGAASGIPTPPIKAGRIAGAAENRSLQRATTVADTTRVGRWMSKEEYEKMVASGKVQEGAGGRTYIGTTPSPSDYTRADPGSIYIKFDVPSVAVIGPAGDPNWGVIPRPGTTTDLYQLSPSEPFSVSSVVCVVGC